LWCGGVPDAGHRVGEESRRPTFYSSRQAISAGHYLAAAAGFSVLEAGGNAVDAGCCAGLALAVLHPDEVNFAGVAPIMIRTREGRVVTIAGLGHWPCALPPDLFMREHRGAIPLGCCARSCRPRPMRGSLRFATSARWHSGTSPAPRSVMPPRDSRSSRTWRSRSPPTPRRAGDADPRQPAYAIAD
jgi:hypothetical protein